MIKTTFLIKEKQIYRRKIKGIKEKFVLSKIKRSIQINNLLVLKDIKENGIIKG